MTSLQIAERSRIRAIEIASRSKTPHIGSALSVIDILSVLYSNKEDIEEFVTKSKSRPRIILSKGHSAIGFYAVMEQIGLITRDEFESYCLPGSNLLGHITHNGKNYVELSTGSLGHGLPYAVGIAKALKMQRIPSQVFVIISDGECNEGTTWEAALIARQLSLNNLRVLIDRNSLQSITSTEKTLALEPLDDKWKAFGWNVLKIDGHSHSDISSALRMDTAKPLCIVAKTTKGKGVSFMENNNLWHYKPPSESEYLQAKHEIESRIELAKE